MGNDKGTGSPSVDSFLSEFSSFAQAQRNRAATSLQAARAQVAASGGAGAALLSTLGLAQREGERAAVSLQNNLEQRGILPSSRSSNLVTVGAGLVVLGGVSYVVYSRFFSHRPRRAERHDLAPPPAPAAAMAAAPSSSSSSSSTSSQSVNSAAAADGGRVGRLLHRTSKSISVAWAKVAPRFGTAPPGSFASASGESVPTRARRFFSSFSGGSAPGLPKPEDVAGCAYLQLQLLSKPPLHAASLASGSASAVLSSNAWMHHPVIVQHLAAIDRALMHAEESLLIGLEMDTDSFTLDEINELLGLYYNAVATLAYGKHQRDPTFSFTFLLPLPSAAAAAASAASPSGAADSAALGSRMSQDLFRRVAGLPDLGAVLFCPCQGSAEQGHAPASAAFMRELGRHRSERSLPDVRGVVMEGVAPEACVALEGAAASSASAASAGPAHGKLRTYTDVVLGGTFDHLHIGHKILLTVASLVATRSLVIGLTVDAMLSHKKFPAQMESWTVRLHSVLSFLTLVHPGLAVDLVPLHDMYGPSGDRAYLTCLVVSEETAAGGPMVNAKRKENGLQPLDIVVVRLAKPAPLPGVPENPADKISSTTLRQWDAEKPQRQRAFLTAQWNALCSSLRISGESGRAMLEQLLARYSEPHRAYHTLDHVESLLRLVATHRAALLHPDEVALAVWFHDAVYDTPSSASASASAGPGQAHSQSQSDQRAPGSNEIESERLFSAFAQQVGLNPAAAGRVSRTILATIRHQVPEASPDSAGGAQAVDLEDLKYFLDFDLAILAASEAGQQALRCM